MSLRTVDSKEQEIFLNAIQIESAIERKDYVYQVCSGNENLRERVNNLLSIHAQGSFILDKNVGLNQAGEITTDIEGTADLTGSNVGSFHLVRLIGSGGMGDVYLAEQKEPIRRRVAVKVIKLGLDTKNFLTRFADERQALALMDHEGITKVFEAGATKTGRPYFAMELVAGDPISKYCDDNRLGLRERLEIFLGLCKAIQHAHQKGVIHRDLKPSNILVTCKDGVVAPKVIDFGVSKATTDRDQERTDLTRLTCMIGTPEYMSPEQADTQGNGQDVRTDVYSLGAILYELMTGSTPFELEELKKKNLMTVREIIQTRAVERPTLRISKLVDSKPQVFRDRATTAKKLAEDLKGNLNAVVSKCLAKDRAQRYSSVSELADDLNRHLAGDPVSVIQLSRWGRLASFSKKKRQAMIGGVLLVTLLGGLVASSIYSTVRANRFAAQTVESESIAKSRLSEANRVRRKAQLEKARAENTLSRLVEENKKLLNEKILLKAIAKFNRRSPDDESLGEDEPAHCEALTPWLKIHLGHEVASSLPFESRNDIGETGDADLKLLTLWLAEQRTAYGNSDVAVARTLDLLGEKHLGLGNYKEATEFLRESLFIRTDIQPKSEKRVRTMELLAKSLKRSGKEIEASSYLESAKRLSEKFSNQSM